MSTGTQTEVVMPQMGVSVSEGTITKWLKQVGETIGRDEPLLEISTDKVDTEVPSPAEGVVTQILAQEGETVEVGTVIALIGPEGAQPAQPAPQDAPTPEPTPAEQPRAEQTPAEQPPAEQPPAEQPPAEQPPVAPPQPAAPPPPPDAAPAPAPAVPAERAAEPVAGEMFEPMTAMRRGIAEHMRRSLDTSAHVTSAIEVDMSRVVEVRKKLKPEYERTHGVNVTYLSFIARAAVETLKDYPWINGEIRADQIVTRSYVNLGFAVELADGKGLIVPVLRNAETLNLLGIAKGVTDIAQRARDKKLLPDEVHGGTFTITNPGGYGTFHGTPVISQPQAAILGTYAVVKRPWVVQDEFGEDAIAIRPIMNLTLTYDHRLVDGALAGRFLRDLREKLETWDESAY